MYGFVSSAVVTSGCRGIGRGAGGDGGGEQRSVPGAAVAGGPFRAGGGIGRSDAGRCGAVDAAGSGPVGTGRARWHVVGSGDRRIRGRAGREFPAAGGAGDRGGDARTRPQCAPGSPGVVTGSLVLLSVSGRVGDLAGRADPHGSAAWTAPRPATFRVRLVPIVELRLLHRLRAHGQGRPRPGRASGRLHLRARLDTRPRGNHGGTTLSRRSRRSSRLPAALCALQGRATVARRARRVSVAGHHGRSRGRQQLGG